MFWLLTYYLLNIEKVGPDKEGEKIHLQLLHLQAAMVTWGREVGFSYLFCSASIHTCCMLNGCPFFCYFVFVTVTFPVLTFSLTMFLMAVCDI